MSARAAAFAVFGGPFAWFLQLLVGWLVSMGSCAIGSAARGVDLAVATVALAATLAAFAIALRAWRGTADGGITQLHARSRQDYVAEVALLASGGSLAAIALTLAALLTVATCGSMR